MTTLKPGDTVALKQTVLRRTDHIGASARGTVVSVRDNIVRVDWHGTWIAHEDGGTVRSIPAANLTRVLTNGAVFGD